MEGGIMDGKGMSLGDGSIFKSWLFHCLELVCGDTFSTTGLSDPPLGDAGQHPSPGQNESIDTMC